jgi:hypothetical protein
VLADAFFAKGQYTLEELFQRIIALLEHGPIISLLFLFLYPAITRSRCA